MANVVEGSQNDDTIVFLAAGEIRYGRRGKTSTRTEQERRQALGLSSS